MHLSDIANMVRSKNAGPFVLTFDIMFDNKDAYQRVVRSGVITAERFAKLYGVQEDLVKVFYHERAQAIKVTMPRRVSSGAPEDTDVYGCQQHGPICDLVIE
ncbi:MAG: DUF4387 domain-containing protein [Betaproteobacteria bacterium]|nr:DUF4387 domain-containing protein [Betaproteobacteria bacterium]